MRNEHTYLVKRAASLAVGAALALACIACGKPVATMATSVNDETGAITCTVENADASSSTTTGFTLGENDLLLVSPTLDSGTVRIDLYTEGHEDDKAISLDASGRVLDTFEVAPGEYVLSFTGTDGKPATGSVLVHSIDREEFKAQNESLGEALSSANEEASSVIEGITPDIVVVQD